MPLKPRNSHQKNLIVSNVLVSLFQVVCFFSLALIFKAIFLPGGVSAAINESINFQGKLVQNDVDNKGLNVSDGWYYFQVGLYNDPVTDTAVVSADYNFDGSISSVDSSTQITYTGSNESGIKSGMYLWNKDDGDFAVISSVDTGTNQIVLDRAINSGDYSWSSSEEITTKTKVTDGVFNLKIVSFQEFDYEGSLSSITDSTHVVYSDPDSKESTIAVGMALWNLADGDFALITNVDTGSNTITLDRSINTGDFSWTVGEGISTKVVEDQLYLGVGFDSDNNGSIDETFKPYERLGTVPYAFRAEFAEDYATRYFSRDSEGRITVKYAGDDVQLDDDGDIIFGTDDDFKLILEESLGRLDFSDGSNSMFYIQDDGSVGSVFGTGSLTVSGGGSMLGSVFNESGGSNDFRIEGSSDSNVFFVDGSTDRIGVGLTTGSGAGLEEPESLFQIGASDNRGDVTLYGDEIIKGATTWSSLSNINQVFVYDTTKDSDGGAWREGSSARSSSWYNETLDDADGTCDNFLTPDTGDDRCGSKLFPKRAVLVTTDSALYIFDAKDNSPWMRFDNGTSNRLIGTQYSKPESVFALDSIIYFSSVDDDLNATDYSLFGGIDFEGDSSWWYGTNWTSTSQISRRGGISDRNSSSLDWNWTTPEFATSATVFDIYAQVLKGDTYVVAATDTGVSIINQTEMKSYDSAFTNPVHNVHLTSSGSLYYSTIAGDIRVVYDITDITSDDWVHDVDYSSGNEGVNVVYNPSFETSDSYWGESNGVFARVSSGSSNLNYMGSYYAHYTPSSADYSQTVFSPEIEDVVLGQDYTFSAYVDPGDNDTLNIVLKDTNGSWDSTEVSVSSPGYYSVTRTIRSGATAIQLGFYTYGSSEDYYFDMVQLSKGSSAINYIDGSLGDAYSWKGTAHDSISIRKYGNDSNPAFFNTSSGEVNDLFVLEGAGVNGDSNLIYIATDSGLTAIYENQGAESEGWAKYITKDYISYEFSEDYATMLSFEDGSLSNGDLVSDSGLRGGDFTAVADAGGITAVSGVKGMAYDLDGTNDYLVEKSFDSNQGTLTFNGNNFDDSGQDFTEWQTIYGEAEYVISVRSSNGNVRWGYLGQIVDRTEIQVYQDRNLNTAGWLGATGTPTSYEIRRSEMFLDGSFTLGGWFKSSVHGLLWSRADTAGTADLYFGPLGTGIACILYNTTITPYLNAHLDDVASYYMNNEWHYLVAVYDSDNIELKLYVDGIHVNTDDTPSGTRNTFNASHLKIGQWSANTNYKFDGSIDEPFVIGDKLGSTKIWQQYQEGIRSLQAHDTDGDGVSDDNSLNSLQGSSNQVNAVDGAGSFVYAGTEDGVTVFGKDSDSVVDSYTDSNKTDDSGSNLGSESIGSLSVSGNIDYESNDDRIDQSFLSSLAIGTSTGVWLESSDISLFRVLSEFNSDNLVRETITLTGSFLVSDNGFYEGLGRNTESTNTQSTDRVQDFPALEISSDSIRGYAFQETSFSNLLSGSSFEVDTNTDGLADGWANSSVSANSLSSDSKYGSYSQSLTADSDSDYVYQSVSDYNDYLGSKVTASVWVKMVSASEICQLWVCDGVNCTYTEDVTTSDWKRLWVSHPVSPDATSLSIRLYPSKDGSGSSAFDGVMLQEGELLSTFVMKNEFSDISVDSDILPDSNDMYSLGSLTAEWNSLYLGDDDGIFFGQDQDFTLGWNNTSSAFELGDGSNTFMSVSDVGTYGDITFEGSSQLQFNSSDSTIYSSSAGQLDLDATDSISIDSPVVSMEQDSDWNLVDNESAFSVMEGDNLYLNIDTSNNKVEFGNNSNRVDVDNFGDNLLIGDITSENIAGLRAVFVYDTSKDSDGGFWRNDAFAKASSWYNETLGDSDRGGRAEFPEVAIIAVSSTNITIYDSKDNSSWMVFSPLSSEVLYPSGVDVNSITARDGSLYLGTQSNGVYEINFIKDSGYKFSTSDANDAKFIGKISDRNTANGWDSGFDFIAKVIDDGIQDVEIQTVESDLYLYVATNSGVSLLNLSKDKAIDISDNTSDDYNAVWLTSAGDLYAVNETQAQLEVWYSVNSDFTDKVSDIPSFIYDESSTPSLWNLAPSVAISSGQLIVSEGSSISDDEGNVVYWGHNGGLVAIHEKQGDESNGAVKYYSSTYISELMIGDVRGMWSLFNNASNTTISDVSVNANNLTASANTNTIASSGVRGLGVSLSTEYASIADNSDFDFGSEEDFSISLWIKHNTISTNSDYILTKSESGTNGGYKLYMDSDGDLVFAIDDDSTWGPDDSVGGGMSKNYDDNNWHHVVAVKKGTTGIYLYVDGELVDSDELLTSTGTLLNDDALYLGIDDDGASNTWVGSLDELMITAEALTPNYISSIYETGTLALNNHTANRITGITDANSYQMLSDVWGAASNLDFNDSESSIYVGVDNSYITQNSGGLVVLGVESDSIVDVFTSSNTDKLDDSGTGISASDRDIIALSVSGDPEHSYNSSENQSSSSGVLSFIYDDDGAESLTGSKLWIQRNNISLCGVLNQISSNTITKNVVQSSELYVGFNGDPNILDPGLSSRNSVFSASVANREVEVGNEMFDSELNIYGNINLDGKVDVSEIDNIVDLYVYDTLKDIDGGSWRANSEAQTTSWYQESLDDAGLGRCDSDSMDRCGSRAFPQRSILVLTDESLLVIDVSNGNLWMKFELGGTGTSDRNLLGASTDTLSSVFAENGVIYVTGTALHQINFKQDSEVDEFDTSDLYLGDISDRNSGNGE